MELFDGMVKGKAYYFRPNVTEKYQGEDTGKYTITLEVDKKTAAALKKGGATVVRNKRVGTDKDGNAIELDYSVKAKTKHRIKCIDAARNSLDKAIDGGLGIGNGSKVVCHLNTYTTSRKPGLGVNMVQIVELIEYNGSSANAGMFSVEGEGIADNFEAKEAELNEDLDDSIPF
ncbi:MAG: hypothetical protein QQN63_00335 [Nitrosopumilus sp.]